MSIGIIFNQKETDVWLKNLNKLLPDEKIEIYPSFENTDAIDFLIVWKPHESYLTEFRNLKVIQSVGAGIDHLYPSKIPQSIQVSRIVDPALKQDLFEHVLTCVLQSMKNFTTYLIDQQTQNWQPKKYLSIAETKITILGLGEIGKHVAEEFARLGFQVNGWSNSAKNIKNVTSFVGKEQLKDAVNGSHFVVNILPLTGDTKEILNDRFFSWLTAQTTLINVGRGAHLKEDDLLFALENNHLREAYLDVFNLEPLSKNHPFWSHPKIFITPHVASITNPETAILQVVENYKRLRSNNKLLHLVDLKKGY